VASVEVVAEPTRASVEIGASGPRGRPTEQELERAVSESAEGGYRIEGGTLSVVGAVGYDLNPEFRQKCDELLASGEKELMLDLSSVLYLSSSHIGVLANLATRAIGEGKKIRLRVTGKVARVLKFAGFDQLGEMQVV
jgi:anti-anti-sigma factor